MSNKPKKGRNCAAVDNWLESLGFYRKNVAYDETCLFRAASEQLFGCQIHHERVRRECIEYARIHFYEFWHLLENEDQWYEHLELLEKHMVVCGNIEMQIISYKYDCDVIVYDAAHQEIVNVTKRDLDKTISVCLMNDDHYDVVHQMEHIKTAGFCQSIVYNLLYENVFNIPNVEDIVRGMLYDKEFVAFSFSEVNNNSDTVKAEIEDKTDEDSCCLSTVPLNIAPFPFKVAKALDPTIYRNIEYDSWVEVRRELRLGEWYYGDDNFILGTKCILNDRNETYECYIQEILKNQNKCVVYVTKLAEKRTVNYTDLSPENDAKPWPLPYRFTKNFTPAVTTQKTLKLPSKKRKDKKRPKINSESASFPPELPDDIDAFIGAPLQIQNKPRTPTSTPEKTAPETPLSQHNLLVTPEVSSPMPKFSWETPWSNTACAPKENFVYNKPMVSPAPVTPTLMSYECPFPFVYQVDNGYNPFLTPANDFSPEPEETAEFQTYDVPQVHDRPVLAIPPPQPVEVFSPILPIHPGTPVIYTQRPEMQEAVIPGSPYQVYTPPVEVQYVTPTTSPYFYTSAWYPVGINSQGFIFPPPVNQNQQN